MSDDAGSLESSMQDEAPRSERADPASQDRAAGRAPLPALLWQEAKRIFAEAIALPPADREAFVRGRAAGEAALLRELLSMLAQDEEASGFLEPASGPAPEDPAPPAIEGFTILGCIGRGGMGVVYLAEQHAPRRRVALKLLSTFRGSQAAVRRFEFEAQVLAGLEHPGIARIYEVGTSESPAGRRPWFAMELVLGPPLVEYAEQNALGRRERLRLFVKVCRAVQHAHQKGVIHRDLKPDNILVDPAGDPRVLDFGIARAVGADAGVRGLDTQTGLVLGTLAYMSPEQLGTQAADVDTRADVYALGVMLYELLAGRRPFELAGESLPASIRLITEEEPPRLSSFDRSLRDELDTIAAKALEKERARRYASASEMADDVERYLCDEPIAARRASTAYLLRKFARRKRALVTGVLVALAALVLGSAATLWQAVRATRARDFALDALEAKERATERALTEEQRALEAADGARREAERARAIKDFLARILVDSDPWVSGSEARVADAVLRAQTEIDASFPDDPEIRAELHSIVGRTLRGLGLYTEARGHLEKGFELLREFFGLDDERTLDALHVLGAVLADLDELDAAEASIALALERRSMLHGAVHPETLSCLRSLSGVFKSRGEHQRALASLQECLEGTRTALGDEDPATQSVVRGVAALYREMGRLEDAERTFREAAELGRSHLGADDAGTLIAEQGLSAVYFDQGRYAESEALVRSVLERMRAVFGEEHRDTLGTAGAHAAALRRLRRFDEAEVIELAVFERLRARLGPEHSETLFARNQLAVLYLEAGRPLEAEPHLLATYEARLRVLGAGHPDTQTSAYNLVAHYYGEGHLVQALAIARQVYESRLAQFGEEGAWTLQAASTLLLILAESGELEEGRELAARWLPIARGSLNADHPAIRSLTNHLALLLHRAGDLAEAEELTVELCALSLRTSGAAHPETARFYGNLGTIRRDRGDLDGAGDAFEQALRSALDSLGGDHPQSHFARSQLATVLGAKGRLDEALGLSSEALAGVARRLPADSTVRLSIQCTHAGILADLERYAEAEPLLLDASQRMRATLGEDDPRTQRVQAQLARVQRELASD